MSEAPRTPRTALPAQQARSRATLERLLEAAEELIRERGLEGATVEGIAAQAGVSVGIVYRRFPHKDGLIRAVYERFFERREAINAQSLARERWVGCSALEVVRSFVAGAVAGAARERRAIRALSRFAAEHGDRSFRVTARRLNAATHRRLCERIVEAVPPARRARVAARVGLAVDVMLLALRGYLIADGPPSGVNPNREALVSDLTALVARYLEIEDSGRRAPGERLSARAVRKR
jgi:AcrR family transcriptional regulator